MKRRLLRTASLMMIIMLILTGAAGCAVNNHSDAAQESASPSASPSAQASPSVSALPPTQTSSSETAVPTPQVTMLIDGGIKGVYTPYGIKIGTCLSDIMAAQSKYTDLIKQNFNSITLENYMKPDSILNKAKSMAAGDIVVEFPQKTTALLNWAKSNGIPVRGHTLIWHSQTPNWIFHVDFDESKGLVDRDTMLSRMESYIKQAFGLLDTLGYTDMFYAYDVVNEAIMENGTYRDSLWDKIIGHDYIWYAFSYADKYAPESIKLFYNDYNEQQKTSAIVKLAQSLVDKNGRSLIDGIGCQGHLYTTDSIDRYMETLKAFSALGLDVQITELDVGLGSWKTNLSATDANLKTQGQYYYNLLSGIVEANKAGATKVTAVTFWGFSDNLSWRRQYSPLLFDSFLKPKYAYYGAILDHDHAGF